jgi:branched-chain amino acid transport system substrate-binding protein
MDGIYAANVVQNPYLDEASQPIRFWANKYKTKFNEDPAVFSAYGYIMVDIFIQAAQKAGPNLTTASFVKAMNGISIPSDFFGTPPLTFTNTKRLGSEAIKLSQIQDGKWRPVMEIK